MAPVLVALPYIAAAMSIAMTVYSAFHVTALPNSSQEGPRLGDNAVTASSYGLQIPIGSGNIRVAGNVIWAMPIQETSHAETHTAGGGKGKTSGGRQTVTTYTYSCTFAVLLAEGPAEAVVRIWMNGTLVYDARTGQDTAQRAGLSFRFYPGNETQLPDSLIEADKGAGNVSAHRGLCYLVFENLPLADWGNRIPNITVELAYATTDDQTPVPISPAAPAVLGGSWNTEFIAINPLTMRAYTWVSGGTTGIAEFGMKDMTVTGEHRLGDIVGDPAWNSMGVNVTTALNIGGDQKLYALTGTKIFQIDPSAWTKTGEYDLDPVFLTISKSANRMAPIVMAGANGQENFMMVSGTQIGNMGSEIEIIELAGMTRVASVFSTGHASFFGGGPLSMCFGKIAAMNGQGWVVSTGGGSPADGTLYLDRVDITESIDVGLFGYDVARNYTITNVLTVSSASLDPTADGFYSTLGGAGGLIYDETDDGVIWLANTISGFSIKDTYLFKYSTSGGLLWRVKMAHVMGPLSNFQSKITGGRLSVFAGYNLTTYDLTDGTVLFDVAWTRSCSGAQIYDTDANALICQLSSGTWNKVYANRVAAASEPLSTIYRALCQDVGLAEGTDFDVSGLTDTVEGYVISQRTSAANALRPLSQLFLIDAVERDYKIVFQPRGGAIAADLLEDDLVRTASEEGQAEPYTEIRQQEIEFPARFSVSYQDIGFDYQINTQLASRVREPNPTMFSDQQLDLQVAVVLSADTARKRAEVLLYTAWLERHTFKFMLSPEFLWLDPADPVTLTLNSGYMLRGRIGQTDIGVDYSIDTSLVAETDGQYVSATSGGAAAGFIPQVIPSPLPSALFLLDVPLLRDLDELGTTGIRGYWAAADFGTGGWPGCQFQASQDGTAFQDMGIATSAAAWGNLETALPDASGVFHLMEEQSVVVNALVGGTRLASVTETQLANGLNAAAVLEANGEVEIIQFLTVTALGGTHYQLTGLARGRRGTDTMATGHAVGEQIVFLGTATITPFALPLAALNQTGFYRAVTAGTLPATAILDRFRFTGRDKMPWAPVNVRALPSGGNIVLTWNRRTRTNGALHDLNATVPVGELSEHYSIDVYDAASTTVLRTLSAASETVTYAAANIAADFGSPPATLNVAVYQISDAMGRGFGRIDTVAVAA